MPHLSSLKGRVVIASRGALAGEAGAQAAERHVGKRGAFDGGKGGVRLAACILAAGAGLPVWATGGGGDAKRLRQLLRGKQPGSAALGGREGDEPDVAVKQREARHRAHQQSDAGRGWRSRRRCRWSDELDGGAIVVVVEKR